MQPIIQVAAKFTVGNGFRDFAVGGGYNSHVHSDGSIPTQTLEFLVLQNAKQLRLQFERNLADFIQKQRAFVSQLKPTDLLADCSSKGAFFVPKKLAFQKPSGDGGTVKLHQIAAGSRAQFVDRTRYQLFASAGLSQNEYSRPTRRDCLYLLQNVGQRSTLTDNFLKIKCTLNILLKGYCLFGYFPFQIRNLVTYAEVVHRYCYLCGYLLQQFDFGLAESAFFLAGYAQAAQRTSSTDQR